MADGRHGGLPPVGIWPGIGVTWTLSTPTEEVPMSPDEQISTALAALVKAAAERALTETGATIERTRLVLRTIPDAHRGSSEFTRLQADLKALAESHQSALARLRACPSTPNQLIDVLEACAVPMARPVSES
jgi:hypothetical protein